MEKEPDDEIYIIGRYTMPVRLIDEDGNVRIFDSRERAIKQDNSKTEEIKNG